MLCSFPASDVMHTQLMDNMVQSTSSYCNRKGGSLPGAAPHFCTAIPAKRISRSDITESLREE